MYMNMADISSFGTPVAHVCMHTSYTGVPAHLCHTVYLFMENRCVSHLLNGCVAGVAPCSTFTLFVVYATVGWATLSGVTNAISEYM